MLLFTLYCLLLVFSMRLFDGSNMCEGSQMFNLRKFGIRFGDFYEQLHEEEENEMEKKKKLEHELMQKRLEIIQKYLMPHTGSTSILKDILSRY
jgi:hypothetical protein